MFALVVRRSLRIECGELPRLVVCAGTAAWSGSSAQEPGTDSWTAWTGGCSESALQCAGQPGAACERQRGFGGDCGRDGCAASSAERKAGVWARFDGRDGDKRRQADGGVWRAGIVGAGRSLFQPVCRGGRRGKNELFKFGAFVVVEPFLEWGWACE
jgi:hypothetical protein